MLLNCGVGEDSWESLGLQGDPTSPFWRRSALGFLWREWCWFWNSSTLATSCKELTHWKSLWCWEGLGAGGEGDDRGWDGWMASLTWWTWVWVNSGSWWWTGRPDVLRVMGSQRVGHDWATDLIWYDLMTTDLTTVFFKCLHTVHLYPRTTESFGKHCITASLASEALSLAHNSNSSEHDFQASHISTSQCLRSILIRSHCQFARHTPNAPLWAYSICRSLWLQYFTYSTI